MNRLLIALPLLVIIALAAIFFVRLEDGGDPSRIPSALINKPAPAIALPGLEGRRGFGPEELADGKVKVINVFASWCAPCRVEHPLLTALHGQAELWGINQKDDADAALGMLAELGNPYDRIGVDRDGRASIEWGVYGVPETFVVDGKGIIRWKHVGPLTPAALRDEVLPAIRAAGDRR